MNYLPWIEDLYIKVTLIHSPKSGSVDKVIINLDGNMYPNWNRDIMHYSAWSILNKMG